MVPRAWRILLGAVLTLGALGCGSDDRPSTAEWQATWDRAKSLLPTADQIVAGGKAECDVLLGDYRTEFADLTPSPAASLDTAVEEWAAAAERLVFECPHDDLDDLNTRFEKIDLLADEVDAGLTSLSD